MQRLPRAPGDTAYSGDSAAILHFLLQINGTIIEPCIHLAAFKGNVQRWHFHLGLFSGLKLLLGNCVKGLHVALLYRLFLPLNFTYNVSQGAYTTKNIVFLHDHFL